MRDPSGGVGCSLGCQKKQGVKEPPTAIPKPNTGAGVLVPIGQGLENSDRERDGASTGIRNP